MATIATPNDIHLDSIPPLSSNTSVHTQSSRPQSSLADDDQATFPLDTHTGQALPPADRGYQAWLTLAICFVLEGTIWGFPYAFGVFQAYYTTHAPFSASPPSTIAAIGTTATGVSYFVSPLAALIIQRHPRWRRGAMLVGLALTVTSLLTAGACSTATGLLATQGLLYGLGSLALYFPALTYIDEWFVVRKGLAYGVMWAGTGTAGAAVPFVLQWALEKWGYRVTLWAWAGVVFAICLPCAMLLKPRLPVSASGAVRPQSLAFLRRAPFWLFTVGVAGLSMGYALPPLWLPSFAADIHLPAYAGPLSLALFSAASSLGAVAFGILVDRFHVSLSIFITSAGLVVAALVFWGLTASQAMLYIFAMLWGTFGGGFTATWSGCAMLLRRLEPSGNVDTGLVLALMAASKGLGTVVSGPLSAKLLQVGWDSNARFAYGTQYGPLVVFSGLSVMVGTTACIGRLFKLL